MSTLSIVALVLLAIVVVLVIAAAVWWLRTQGGAAIRSFYGAVRQMEQEQGTRDRYQTPWLMMLGNETDGAQLCSQWRLQPTDKAGWFGRWFCDAEGAVLVVPQALFLPDEGMNRQRGNWWRLLGLLLRLRSKRPLDGVIWTVPFGKLDDIEQTTELSLKVRRVFIDLLQRFGLSLPVYVVITGMEELPGFQELVSALPAEARESMLGCRRLTCLMRRGNRTGVTRRWMRLTPRWRNRSSRSVRCRDSWATTFMVCRNASKACEGPCRSCWSQCSRATPKARRRDFAACTSPPARHRPSVVTV